MPIDTLPTRDYRYRNRNRSVSIVRVLKISGAKSPISTKPSRVKSSGCQLSEYPTTDL